MASSCIRGCFTVVRWAVTYTLVSRRAQVTRSRLGTSARVECFSWDVALDLWCTAGAVRVQNAQALAVWARRMTPCCCL